MEKFPLKSEKALEEYKKLILTPEQYAETDYAKEGNFEEPYTYELESNAGKQLGVFGSIHTNDPAHPVFNQINDAFNRIKPDKVFVEGVYALNSDPDAVLDYLGNNNSLEESKVDGETMYALKLVADAKKDDTRITAESPEPAFIDEITHLEENNYSQSDIVKFYFYRQIGQYLRNAGNATPKAMQNDLHKLRQEFLAAGWQQETLSVVEAELLSDVSPDPDHYLNSVDPIPWPNKEYGLTNKISAASNAFRDAYIFDRIAQNLEKYDTLFVIYGSKHAVVLEPALRELFKD